MIKQLLVLGTILLFLIWLGVAGAYSQGAVSGLTLDLLTIFAIAYVLITTQIIGRDNKD